jgi:urea ABC transporter ATP-binding protein UrtD
LSALPAPLLAARNITKRFGGVLAVDDVSVSIGPGEIKCIIGANGAGKSTLFNVLCGSVRATSGTVTFDGREVSSLPLYQFSRIGIARKFQIPSVFDSMSVARNLSVAVLGTAGGELQDRIGAMLALIGLDEQRDQVAGTLAHGQKQWLEIGMALMSGPKLLLLDEPTAGMTSEETQTTASLVRSLAKETAIIAIEHDMSFVRALGCQTLVMHQGRLIAEGSFAAVERDPLVRDVYLGRA